MADWTKQAIAARRLGKPFSHVLKNLSGAVQSGDYSRIGDFSKINFPSRFHGLTVSALSAIAENPVGNNYLEKLISSQNIVQGIGALDQGDDIDRAKADYLRKNNEVFAKLLTRAPIVGRSDYDELLGLRAAWSNAVTTQLSNPNSDTDIDRLETMQKELDFQQHRLDQLPILGILEGATGGYMDLLKGKPTTSSMSAFLKAQTEAEAEHEMQNNLMVGMNPLML